MLSFGKACTTISKQSLKRYKDKIISEIFKIKIKRYTKYKKWRDYVLFYERYKRNQNDYA